MYIDYGNCEWLETEKAIRLPQHFFQLRPMSVLVRLSGKNEMIFLDILISGEGLLWIIRNTFRKYIPYFFEILCFYFTENASNVFASTLAFSHFSRNHDEQLLYAYE